MVTILGLNLLRRQQMSMVTILRNLLRRQQVSMLHACLSEPCGHRHVLVKIELTATKSLVSASKSSSTCSSTSPFSPHATTKKSLEEVWNDINHSFLHGHATTNRPSICGIVPRDYLVRPFNKDPPTRGDASTEPSAAKDATLFRSSTNSPFSALASSSVFPSFCKKRAPQKDRNYGDGQQKRLMKNRECAARCRAKKRWFTLLNLEQAYTSELELEVANLKEENARLRKRQEKVQLLKKNTLSRTSTAPF
ncbi:hypothetical protein L1049_026633 [Liquidambar formosana]|uniref:BZIP domain-containing protein n=1 Tax=Liquidambar formosana TaxID=63359 RepID=A0AAP0NGR9_LIQFO